METTKWKKESKKIIAIIENLLKMEENKQKFKKIFSPRFAHLIPAFSIATSEIKTLLKTLVVQNLF